MNVSVCLSMCLSVSEHIPENTRIFFTKYFCTLPTAVAQCSSGSVAIGYVLPVLWMASCLHIMARTGWALRRKRMLKVTQLVAAEVWHRGVYSN